ncbi:hypothetical protein Taro_039555 [Colocasia esculenta]|uniref:Uncharacterized protein n=1 Tax=Colocasia esculenta TaxID=4460 RepID=A0A843WJ85_COLES|nr:hypothetical protein [Colocasia esculenta]
MGSCGGALGGWRVGDQAYQAHLLPPFICYDLHKPPSWSRAKVSSRLSESDSEHEVKEVSEFTCSSPTMRVRFAFSSSSDSELEDSELTILDGNKLLRGYKKKKFMDSDVPVQSSVASQPAGIGLEILGLEQVLLAADGKQALMAEKCPVSSRLSESDSEHEVKEVSEFTCSSPAMWTRFAFSSSSDSVLEDSELKEVQFSQLEDKLFSFRSEL